MRSSTPAPMRKWPTSMSIHEAVRHPGTAVLPRDIEAEARLAPARRGAQGPAGGRRSRDGQGLARLRLHADRRSCIPRPGDDGLRDGDDRRGGTVLVPRDRAGRPPARAQAAAGPAPSCPTSRSRWPCRREGECVGHPAPEDRDGHRSGTRARHGPADPRRRIVLLARCGDRKTPVRQDRRPGAIHVPQPARPDEVSVFRMPPAHVSTPGPHWKEFTIPAGAGRIELEPMEAIPAAPPLRFVVRDETGKPAPRTRPSPGSRPSGMTCPRRPTTTASSPSLGCRRGAR